MGAVTNTYARLPSQCLEPKAVALPMRRATLRTKSDVDVYLDRLRADIMVHVGANTPVII